MSFAAQVKNELCRIPVSRRCCAQAEAYGMLLFGNLFTTGEVRFLTENDALIARLPLLFKKAFRVEFDRLPAPEEQGKRTLAVTRPDKLDRIRECFGIDPQGAVAHHINFAVLEEECCRLSFLRGAFLAGGSVTDPSRGYHLELCTSHFSVGREIQALMRECGFESKLAARKSNCLAYFKRSSSIEDFLTAIGAPLSAMEMMNAKAEKNLRGSVNRRVNCDAANLDKAVEASQVQLSAIRRLEKSGKLNGLPDKLQEAARLRLEHPEDTLAQLAERCYPPVSKSALNHRLRRLVELGKM